MKAYKVMVGGLTESSCHTEIEVESIDYAVAMLHAFARKGQREDAISNIGDYRTWVGNSGFENIDISHLPINTMIAELISKEEESDRKAELRDNTHIPDISVDPTKEGVARVSSSAMQCECYVKWENLTKCIEEIIEEYRGLIEAEIIGAPTY